MACALSPSQKNNKKNNDEDNDIILQFLDKIRMEYSNFKREKEDIISALQKTNLNLTKTVNNLNDELNCSYGSPINCDKKRRKTTATSSDSEIDSSKLFGRTHVSILDSSADNKSSTDSLFSKSTSSLPGFINKTLNKIPKQSMNTSSDSDFENAKLLSRIKINSSSDGCSCSDKSLDDKVCNKPDNADGSSKNKKCKKEKFSDDSSDTDSHHNNHKTFKIKNNESDKSIDNALNVALNNDNIILDDSDMIFPATQQQTTPKKSIKQSQILSPINCNIIKNKISLKEDLPTPPLMKQLPKRMKSIIPIKKSSPNAVNNENSNQINNKNNNDRWISKKQFNQKNKNNSNWNMSFIQPVKKNINDENCNLNSSGDVIACSQDIPTKSKDRNKTAKLRQSKLEFDLKLEEKNEDDETFCGDIVGASPTCTNSISGKDSKITRTLRKNSRKKSDDDLFIFPNTKISKEIPSKTLINTPSTSKNSIKIEPKTVKKQPENVFRERFFEHMQTDDSIEGLVTINNDNEDNTAKKMLNDDSSLFILPTQPDDVIIVEDSDINDYNLNSMDLLDAMLKDDKDTQPLFKQFEAEQIKSLQSIDTNNKKSISPQPSTSSRFQLPENKKKSIDDDIKLSKIFDDENDFTTTESYKSPEKKGFHHDCDECQKFRKYLIGQNVPPDEIEQRLRYCKKPQRLHHTPDGFWDPRFRELPSNDPRNEILIDYRFVNKKKEQQQQKK